MVAYVLHRHPALLLDPALGEGAFFRAAKRYAECGGFTLTMHGRDIDPEILIHARESGLSDADLQHVELKDFVLEPPREQFPAIVANPPYIRHHRLTTEQKQLLRHYAQAATGRHIDGRAGLHVYFLIRALQSLSPHGRLAYIVSADICEGVFARQLWGWICEKFRLDGVITFSTGAAPFPDVDTNALIFLLANEPPVPEFDWVVCHTRETAPLLAVLEQQVPPGEAVTVHRRTVTEALSTGLSRPPQAEAVSRFTLGDFASVMRGIVTGDNDFFFLTSAQRDKLGIPAGLFVRAVGRTRDVSGDHLTLDDMDRLDENGRPTYLLSLNGTAFDALPMSVQQYLREGERRGIPEKVLIQTRKPWYRMEHRQVPPFLFAYLGRRSSRFIRNQAGVVPLTCLMCIYPHLTDSAFIERLWRVISHPETVANLRLVGKSYGGDAIKVEPRALERLPLPDALVVESGLHQYLQQKQGALDFR